MVKEITVTYGNNTYTREAMTSKALIIFSTTLQNKIACFASSIHEIMVMRDGDAYSRHQCLKDILSIEEWTWLINEVIFNDVKPLKINSKLYSNLEEIENHFAGDALKLLTVAYKFAIANLGEPSIFMENLTGSMKDIIGSLKEMGEEYKKNMETSMNLYANSQQLKKAKNTQKSK